MTEIDLNLPRSRPATVRTDEKTVELVRRLAAYYCDNVIAGILNRQDRTTACGLRSTANHVGNLRRHWDITRFERSANPPPAAGLVNITQAAKLLGIAPSTIHRWLNDGFIAGEQITPGAPWQMRLTDELRNRFVDESPEVYVTMQGATKILSVSRQMVLQRVKFGEPNAVHTYRGKQKGLRINVLNNQTDLFKQTT